MLKKMMRYEFKAFGRKLFPLLPLIPILAIISSLAREGAFALSTSERNMPFVISLAGISIFLGMVAIVAPLLITVFILVSRYYRSMVGREAYLTFTLPIKVSTQLLMRSLSAVLYTMAGAVVAFISSRIIFGFPFNTEFTSVFSEYLLTLHIKEYPVWLYEKAFWAVALLGVLTTLFTVYLAISMSTLLSKNRVLFTIGIYIVLNAVLGSFISLITGIITLNSYATLGFIGGSFSSSYLGALGNGFLLFGTIFRLIGEATSSAFWGHAAVSSIFWESSFWSLVITWLAYFFTSKYIFKKRMSLE